MFLLFQFCSSFDVTLFRFGALCDSDELDEGPDAGRVRIVHRRQRSHTPLPACSGLYHTPMAA
jgi:hypothetical protein